MFHAKSMKVLNLFAGIGGNRKDWPSDVQVTAVEFNQEAADIYKELFPQDTVVVGDAYEYVRLHWHEFNFIWASCPCQSHSQIRFLSSKAGSYDAVLPEMRLWSVIIFLKHFCRNRDIYFVVENVFPYYKDFLNVYASADHQPFIKETVKIGRHLFWSNFPLEEKKIATKGRHNARGINVKGDFFDLSKYKPKTIRKDQLLRTYYTVPCNQLCMLCCD